MIVLKQVGPAAGPAAVSIELGSGGNAFLRNRFAVSQQGELNAVGPLAVLIVGIIPHLFGIHGNALVIGVGENEGVGLSASAGGTGGGIAGDFVFGHCVGDLVAVRVFIHVGERAGGRGFGQLNGLFGIDFAGKQVDRGAGIGCGTNPDLLHVDGDLLRRMGVGDGAAILGRAAYGVITVDRRLFNGILDLLTVSVPIQAGPLHCVGVVFVIGHRQLGSVSARDVCAVGL